MKKLYVLLFLVFAIYMKPASAQQDSTLKADLVKINAKLFGITGTYERRLAPRFSFLVEGGIVNDATINVSRYDTDEAFPTIRPLFGAEGRYYYNVAKRIKREKRTANNSANYLSFLVQYAGKAFNDPKSSFLEKITVGMFTYDFVYVQPNYTVFSLVPNWGIQRMVGKSFSLDLSLGGSINCLSDTKEWVIAPYAAFRLGYIIH